MHFKTSGPCSVGPFPPWGYAGELGAGADDGTVGLADYTVPGDCGEPYRTVGADERPKQLLS